MKSKMTPCGPTMPGPPWVRNVIYCEACERFCWYGLRAVLVLYLTGPLGYTEAQGVSLYSYVSSLGYFMPLVGGMLADTKLGKYKTILYNCIVYLFGCAILSITSFSASKGGCVIGLLLIVVGMGGIKSSVAPFGADQFEDPPDKTRRRQHSAGEEGSWTNGAADEGAITDVAVRPDEALALARERANTTYFMVFYMGINIGALASYVVTPLLRKYVGFGAAFAAPFVLLFVAVVVFWSARNLYVRIPPAGSVLSQLLQIFRAAGGGWWRAKRGQTEPCANFVDHARGQFKGSDIDAAKDLWALLPVFAMLPPFWMCFDQQGSTWTLQARDMRTMGIPPEQMAILNSLFVVGLIPVFDNYLYPYLTKLSERGGAWARVKPTPLGRMGFGMVLCAISFLLSAMVQGAINNSEPHTVNVLWQIPQYVIITASEICISITGLEFAYSQAPPSLKGSIMAVFMLTNSVGDAFTGIIFGIFGHMGRGAIFMLCAVIVLVNLGVFTWIAGRYTYRRDRS